MSRSFPSSTFFFFNDTATTEIYTLSLHDALPISVVRINAVVILPDNDILIGGEVENGTYRGIVARSEEHTSELQSRLHLVCRLLLEKKKKKKKKTPKPVTRNINSNETL